MDTNELPGVKLANSLEWTDWLRNPVQVEWLAHFHQYANKTLRADLTKAISAPGETHYFDGPRREDWAAFVRRDSGYLPLFGAKLVLPVAH